MQHSINTNKILIEPGKHFSTLAHSKLQMLSSSSKIACKLEQNFCSFLPSLILKMCKYLVICGLLVIIVASVASTPLKNCVKRSIQEKDATTQDDKFVSVEPIPGTQLFTGVYYKLGLERFPSGWVTWTDRKHPVGGWHYVQIDSRSDHLPNYQKTGVWYNDIQWFFTPSEVAPGWYTLRNRQLPEDVASISNSERVGNGYHIILNRHAHESEDALWKPVVQKEKNGTEVYKLLIKSLPVASVTWTETQVSENVANSYYLQADTNSDAGHSSKYLENAEWYEDTLFRFTPIDSSLVAQISQVELLLFPKLEEIRGLTRIDCEAVDGLIYTNQESKAVVKELKQKVVNRGYLRLRLGDIPEMKIVGSEGPISPSWYADSIEFHMVKPEVKSTEEIRLKTSETSGVLTNVVVPPWTTTEVRVCREYFDTEGTDVDIDAFVYLELSQRSERPLSSSGKYKAGMGKLPAEQFVYQNVKKLIEAQQASRDEENIDVRWESLLVAGGNSDLGDNFGSTQILGRRETEVVLKTTGVVKGKFGYRSVVASN